jgi:hypothetical protein
VWEHGKGANMGRRGFLKRLAAVRRGAKVWLYAEIGALVRGETDERRAARAMVLIEYLSELEQEDGPGGLERLLAGLPRGLGEQVRQELGRLLKEEAAGEGGEPV